ELQVSDGDIEDYYRSHIADFTAPESIHTAIIFVEVPANATDEERQARQQKAQRARPLAQRPSPRFAEPAQQYSHDPEPRPHGGRAATSAGSPRASRTRASKNRWSRRFSRLTTRGKSPP